MNRNEYRKIMFGEARRSKIETEYHIADAVLLPYPTNMIIPYKISCTHIKPRDTKLFKTFVPTTRKLITIQDSAITRTPHYFLITDKDLENETVRNLANLGVWYVRTKILYGRTKYEKITYEATCNFEALRTFIKNNSVKKAEEYTTNVINNHISDMKEFI